MELQARLGTTLLQTTFRYHHYTHQDPACCRLSLAPAPILSLFNSHSFPPTQIYTSDAFSPQHQYGAPQPPLSVFVLRLHSPHPTSSSLHADTITLKMGFGDFHTICDKTSIPLCSLVGPTSSIAGTTGIQASCYSRSIELANTIIFQGAADFMHILALVMTSIMIIHVRSKFTAVGTSGLFRCPIPRFQAC